MSILNDKFNDKPIRIGYNRANALSLACVQSVYHWLDGQSMPTLDNLYALSDLLKVPMDMLVYGNRRYDPNKNIPEGAERLFRYYRLIQECMAA